MIRIIAQLARCSALALITLILSPGAASGDEPVWKSLFDGESLKGWRSYATESPAEGWQADDGTLHRTAGGGDLATVDQFGNFELELEWKISPGGNSGIIYRARTGDSAPYHSGPEYQVLDNGADVNPKTAAGSLYGLYASDLSVAKPAGEWNSARIVVNGNHVEHWLNGTQVVDCEIGSPDWNERVGASKFAVWEQFAKGDRGHLVLQDHGNEVWYRNLRIREISK